jgi:hypothetical protein
VPCSGTGGVGRTGCRGWYSGMQWWSNVVQ